MSVSSPGFDGNAGLDVLHPQDIPVDGVPVYLGQDHLREDYPEDAKDLETMQAHLRSMEERRGIIAEHPELEKDKAVAQLDENITQVRTWGEFAKEAAAFPIKNRYARNALILGGIGLAGTVLVYSGAAAAGLIALAKYAPGLVKYLPALEELGGAGAEAVAAAGEAGVEASGAIAEAASELVGEAAVQSAAEAAGEVIAEPETVKQLLDAVGEAARQ